MRVQLGPSRNQVNLKRAILEMTLRCNLACVHCSVDAGPKSKRSEMSKAEWLSTVDSLLDYGIDMLVLGGGEPLLREEQVREIVLRCFSRGLATRVTSNGLLLTEDMAKFMSDHAAIISYGCDGLGDAYESFRGIKGSYPKLVRAIELAMKHGILDVLAVTATKVNLDEVPKVIDLCAELGITCVVSKYVPVGRPNFDELLLEPEQRKAMVELVAAKRVEHPHIQITTTREPLEAVVLGTGAMGVQGCIAGTGWCLISALGEVIPCPYFPLVLGNVREQSFADIWELSPHLKRLRDRSGLGEPCGSCSKREICGGCRALAYSVTGDYMAGDPQCWIPGEEACAMNDTDIGVAQPWPA
ncbi:MAG: radical SAM protein [Myxococcota bacterium]|nr:radical SAM protein [Myxococcota bacterium]